MQMSSAIMKSTGVLTLCAHYNYVCVFVDIEQITDEYFILNNL